MEILDSEIHRVCASPFFPALRLYECPHSFRRSLPLRRRSMSCRSALSSRLESSLLCLPGHPFSISSVRASGGRLRSRPRTRSRGRCVNTRLRRPLFRRAVSRTNHMIFFVLYPPVGNERCLVHRRAGGACLRARVPSRGAETLERQEVATEVWTGRGTQAVASAMKRSKRAREAGLMS